MVTVVRVRHADVSREAEVLDVDPPELGLREGVSLNHRDCEERKPASLLRPSTSRTRSAVVERVSAVDRPAAKGNGEQPNVVYSTFF